MQTFTLFAEFEDIEPPIHRTFEMPGRYTLRQLHDVLQILFGFWNSHLHMFEIEGALYTDLDTVDPHFDLGEQDEKVRLDKLVQVGQSFSYLYDFGDSWRVQLHVQENRDGSKEDRPQCLAGERAGPCEDCGGVGGYYELCRALADPHHDKHEEMRTWAGNWQPEAFDLKAINKKLARRFPRPEKRKSVKSGARIGSYLAVRLNLRQQMAAALLERGRPMSLEELAERLTAAGTELSHGVTSLRKAWRRQPPLRENSDGKLELETDHPKYSSFMFWLNYSQPHQKSESEKPVAAEPDLTEPIQWATVRKALSGSGRRPPSLSLRRVLLLALDSEGGQAPLSRVLELVAEVGYRNLSLKQVQRSLTGQSCMRLDEGDILSYQVEHEDIPKARKCLLDWWLPRQKAAEERAGQRQRYEAHDRERTREALERRERFLASRRGVVAWRAAGEVAAAVMVLDSSSLQLFEAGETQSLCQMLSTLDVVIGLDPKGLFEELGLARGERTFIDVTPPFRSVNAGRSRKTVSVAEAVAMTLGRQLSHADAKTEALLEDARILGAYYRYGVQHGAVLRKDGRYLEYEPVRWNIVGETSLRAALRFCGEQGRSLMLSVDPGNVFSAREWERPFQPLKLYDGGEVLGRWQDTGEEVVLHQEQIFSFSGDLDEVPIDRFSCF